MRNSSTENTVPAAIIISDVETTADSLTGRAGLSLFVRYLRSVDLAPHLSRLFGSMRKSAKGQPVVEVFKQVFCFFMDGTSRHLTYFDALKEDAAYGATIESQAQALQSSHAVKRFFRAFSWPRIWLFRRLLQQLFLWRLKLARPPVVVLGIDTMVMDNDEAGKRHGVAPTYKPVKGFQPLQVSWSRFLIDAVFRGGDKHSNYSDTVEKTVRHLVAKIRRHYEPDAPIIIRLDSGFFDQKLMAVFEELEVGYIVAGKLYQDIKTKIGQFEPSLWKTLNNGRDQWEYTELEDQRGSWSKSRRAIFCRLKREDGQQLLEFARPDQILYTNLGCGELIDERLRRVGCQYLVEPDKIVFSYHERGSDELVHRALKDFACQTLPFKRFAPNAAFYYTMLVSFFLFECFKEDVCGTVLPLGAYATTLRRWIIDIAGKIVRHAGLVTLKLPLPTWNRIGVRLLWEKSGLAPCFTWA